MTREDRRREDLRTAAAVAIVAKERDAALAEQERLRTILDGEHHKPGAFDRMTDWAQQMENERDEAQDAAATYWEAWQDAAVYWKDRVKRLESELEDTRQRMRSGWRLVEREGIDEPQPLVEGPRPHPPADLEPLDISD